MHKVMADNQKAIFEKFEDCWNEYTSYAEEAMLCLQVMDTNHIRGITFGVRKGSGQSAHSCSFCGVFLQFGVHRGSHRVGRFCGCFGAKFTRWRWGFDMEVLFMV